MSKGSPGGAGGQAVLAQPGKPPPDSLLLSPRLPVPGPLCLRLHRSLAPQASPGASEHFQKRRSSNCGEVVV